MLLTSSLLTITCPNRSQTEGPLCRCRNIWKHCYSVISRIMSNRLAMHFPTHFCCVKDFSYYILEDAVNPTGKQAMTGKKHAKGCTHSTHLTCSFILTFFFFFFNSAHLMFLYLCLLLIGATMST